MRTITGFIKKETVFFIAAVLALASAVLVPPDGRYLEYVDYDVLILLFNLMLVVAGFQSIGFFAFLGEKLVERVSHTRSLSMVLVFLCFFSSMLITNDVALLTFVPFAILLLQMTGQEKRMIFVIVMQTIAANLGSMVTPVGNPQNLYLYSLTGMGFFEFIKIMLFPAAAAFVLLFLIMALAPGEAVVMRQAGEAKLRFGGKGWSYTVLFLCCMAAVAKVVPCLAVLAAVCAAVLLLDRKLFAKADYFLLATFVCFFVFIGNMERIEAVRAALESMIGGREFLTAIAASQVISNVPAAILLSGFTDHHRALLLGTNLGGLGTLIASLASLISYKFYVRIPGSAKGKYLLQFTAWNVFFLAVLSAAVWGLWGSGL